MMIQMYNEVYKQMEDGNWQCLFPPERPDMTTDELYQAVQEYRSQLVEMLDNQTEQVVYLARLKFQLSPETNNPPPSRL